MFKLPVPQVTQCTSKTDMVRHRITSYEKNDHFQGQRRQLRSEALWGGSKMSPNRQNALPLYLYA